jgi:hypothetical protein
MYKVKGTITKIEEPKEVKDGAKVLSYILEHEAENGYKTPYNLQMYKKADYAEHIDNFVKYNKVGDVVEVEFTVRGQEYQGRVYNSLNHWNIIKAEAVGNTPQELQPEESDDLPF